MTMNKIAIDTNILLYSVDTFDSVKHAKALDLIAESPFISSQVISETANICLRKWKFSKEKTGALINVFLDKCEFIPISKAIISRATTTIMSKYKLQFFDALIITAALDEGCEVLYSEDMHNSLLVEGLLRIVNPFL